MIDIALEKYIDENPEEIIVDGIWIKWIEVGNTWYYQIPALPNQAVWVKSPCGPNDVV